MSPSALWWINRADNMCPDENRAYVYGVSQDPIRGAVAANLTMLGEGGYAPGGRGLPQRFPHPASSTFIQNNYLRVVVLPDGRMELLHDPERLAQYDNVSPAMRLSPSLLNTTHPAGRVIDSTVEIVEPAGYLSVVESRLELEANGRGFSETRTLTMQSDSPWLRLRVRRNGPPGRFVSRVDLPDYDRIEVGDEIANVVPRSSLAPLVVSCTDGARPPLALLATEPGGLRSFSWGDGHLDLHSDSAEPFEIALVLLDGLYRSQQRYELLRFLSTPRESMAMPGEGGATVQNLLGMPVVEVVRVRSNARGPYHVREFGRWMHRGAQPSRLHPGEDYVKVYLPAQGRAEIRDYGFIDGIARPGWGCQYTTAIVDCTREQSRCAVDVEVNDITSFLFAPRLRFAEPIARAWLDGAPWSYLDGDELFLPNRQGRYHVEIEAGAATEPHLARTFADISQASSTMNTLTFTARLPEWTESVPDGFHFAALIRHPGRELRGLENARLLRGGRDASMIQFDTGEVSGAL
ncbi:hypothetical protein HS125_02755 [bacterium]|nr:hypothetical protein [bacterium]